MGLIIGIIIGSLIISIINYFSNRPPKKLLKLAILNTNDMQIVSRSENDNLFTEEYTDGKNAIRRYMTKPLGKAIISNPKPDLKVIKGGK